MRQLALVFFLLVLICNLPGCGPSGSSKGGNGSGPTGESTGSGATAEGTTDGSTTGGSGDSSTTDGSTDGSTTGGSGDDSAATGSDPGTTGGSADGSTTDGSDTSGSTDGTEDPPEIPFCVQQCSSSADCAVDGVPAYSADNYHCVEGACVYIGCNSDLECEQSFSGMNYGCSSHGVGINICTQKCGSVEDCDLGTAAYSPDNYKCEMGDCIFTGCLSDDECAESLQNIDYVCNKMTSTAPAYCMLGCRSTADCDLGSAAYSTNNYACDGGVCTYTGCNSDDECSETFLDSDYICN